MKQALQLKLSQHLTLTPQLQQSIRLLQLSTTELNQELERFLMENPLLEREDANPEPVAPAAFGTVSAPSGSEGSEARSEPEDNRDSTQDSYTQTTEWLNSASGTSHSRDDSNDSGGSLDALRHTQAGGTNPQAAAVFSEEGVGIDRVDFR